MPDLGAHAEEIAPDFENIQAALFWGFEHAVDRACAFAVALDGGYMAFHKPYPVRRQLLEAAQRAEGQSDLSQAHTLQSLGDLERLEDNYGAARERYNQALALAHQIPDTVCQLNCLIGLARLERAQGNREAACAQYAALFRLTDSLPAFASHPTVQDWKREAAEYCDGRSESGA
ncbi:MAG: hypothetical protein CUN51_08205 [Candidatus Thermofonsia Clade 1 bacterium]|uniref:MalT-like TPR region domain-containing protein n=1 Tax=Candidatus Thermofonsia Clade 1 bacterium TaxID=2364210 RepID=A0A2M8NYB0_9CHLR|nr:MAG: hypothetical protein CUN51_08205 [Candidatus Thermofonsia Clade 1 bacterium]